MRSRIETAVGSAILRKQRMVVGLTMYFGGLRKGEDLDGLLERVDGCLARASVLCCNLRHYSR